MASLGEEIKKLGFGLMRLPMKDEKTIDIEQTKQMVDRFLAEGFTYFDTAWAYAGSEDAIRQALVERYPRESFQLATKNAAWINCKTREDAIAQFETSLKQTGAGYFDFYLLHTLGEHRTHFFVDYDQAYRLFLPFYPGRAGRDPESASGGGICPAADQLRRLGEPGDPVQGLL